MTNVDDLRNVNISAMIKTGTPCIAVTNPVLPFGLVEEIKNGYRFIEKPLLKDKWINCGVYFLSKNIKDILPDKGDLEKDVFPNLSRELKLFFYTGEWHTFNTLKDVEEFENEN